ncbi:hypothetical protein M427DRAFT_486269 [Gonapodya prolifera JEL478]|uniref:O-acyltransferase WSD1-like N-terminal domain-containing protein n=1 Tax=Gonapodya prolifera (strain JEL478) TaxID=1344416 RepID=A0A139B090_GONPJ|nr:hypothetical protein M427DRAFT_486269 [Gonapodya prolifera JEL478]|eukprot:KXS22360.1 hypothetical protein M427DRAFT_486269 [Gonapodya prolifera JEL478]
MFIYLEKPYWPMTVAGLYMFLKRIDPDVIKHQIAGYVLRHGAPVISRIVKNDDGPFPLRLFGRLYFDIATFDLDNHFEILCISVKDEPGNDEAIQSACSKIMSLPWNYTRPLWKVFSLDGLQSPSGEEKCALFWSAHHVSADGQGYIRALLSYVATLDPVTGLPPNIPNHSDTADISSLQYHAGKVYGNNHHDGHVGQTLADSTWTIFLRVSPKLLAEGMWYRGGLKSICGVIVVSTWIDEWRSRCGVWTLFVRTKELTENSSQPGIVNYLDDQGELKDSTFTLLVPVSLHSANDISLLNQSTGWRFFLISPYVFIFFESNHIAKSVNDLTTLAWVSEWPYAGHVAFGVTVIQDRASEKLWSQGEARKLVCSFERALAQLIAKAKDMEDTRTATLPPEKHDVLRVKKGEKEE